MKKVLICFLLLMLVSVNSVYAENQWRAGMGSDTILGTKYIYEIDTESFNNIVDPLDRVLANFRQWCLLSYASASTLTVSQGQVVLSNADGSIRIMTSNPSDTTVTWTDIDTGTEASSTTYYVYAFSNTASDATFDVTISTNATTPTGKTFYRLLGSFVNNASSNITTINNAGFFSDFGEVESKSANVPYQALTDGIVYVWKNDNDDKVWILSDSSSTPTTNRGGNRGAYSQASWVVKKGDYYEAKWEVAYPGDAVYWVPLHN